MAALKDNVKLFITIGLARYLTPTQVAEAVHDEFGLKVERSQVQAYDPTKSQGNDLSSKYIEVFIAARDKFIDEISGTPIALKSYRLKIEKKPVNVKVKSIPKNEQNTRKVTKFFGRD